MSEPRLSILLLCDDRPAHANTIREHIRALRKYSRHDVQVYNPLGLQGNRYLDFDEFDAVVVHYTLLCTSDYHLHHTFRQQLSSYKGLKIQFIQDDYRWVDEITGVMREMGIGLLFTSILEPAAEVLYGSRVPCAVRVPTLTGYVPDDLAGIRIPPLAERTIDIGYRAREIPYWLGRLGQEKQSIARGILERADRYQLRCDISAREEDRIYGKSWIEFLLSCRATLGTGSGASIADYDGSLQRRTDDYLRDHPNASFEEVHREILETSEGNLRMEVISPRIFEAIALRTALILFPSSYSGIIRPWDHYLPLEKDFSNLEEVMRNLRDDEVINRMTERAYHDVVESGDYSFRELARQFDQAIAGRAIRIHRPIAAYRLQRLRRDAARLNLRGRVRSQILGPVAHATRRATQSVLRATGIASLVRLAKDPDDYGLKASLALRAALRSRDRMALIMRWPASRSRRRAASLDMVLEDMLKVDMLRQAREGGLLAGEMFRAWPRISANGVLVLRSAPFGVVDLDALDGADAVRALENGDVKSVVWDHSPVATHVYHALTRRRRRVVRVALGLDGHHRFPWIRELLLRDPAAAVRLLRPSLADPASAPAAAQEEAMPALDAASSPVASTAPATANGVRRDRILGPFARLADDPIGYGARLYLALRAVLPVKGYRRLLLRYLVDGSVRSSASFDLLLEDLLKLDLLRRACAAEDGFAVSVRHSLEGDRWSYVSEVLPAIPAKPPQPNGSHMPTVELVWDHAQVASYVLVPVALGKRLTIYLGPAGRYEFRALPAIARTVPELVAEVLPATVDKHAVPPSQELATPLA